MPMLKAWIDQKIKIARENFEKLGTRYPPAPGIIMEKETIGKVNCYWFYKPGGFRHDRMIMYLHGGCFVLGSVHTFKPFLSHLAESLDLPVLYIEYRLAPEHPFPAAIEDILLVYREMKGGKNFRDITVMGDSAGAGLAISAISFLQRENLDLPQRLVLLSPWLDLELESESHEQLAPLDPILNKEQLVFYTALYLGGRSKDEANPAGLIRGKFPPALFLVGSREILLDDSRRAYAEISASQPMAKLKIYPYQTHDWPLEEIRNEAAADALNEIRNFLHATPAE